MRSPNHPMFYWQQNKDWYKIRDDYSYELTDSAPSEARKSFEIYQQEMKKRKNGVYA
ncbi:hypothetical protein [Streptococcus sp. NLN76]|uniref:hypothetical protein n=1 Tax=Streptococcus sp. NLN76 TaxID=2822800 RepID=UPI0018AB073A|nr:hypothetical protein [Streptococcus sp. NLN76]MBF8970167.1 hypothetical protein [Streptococcus sp. NLN76]